MHLSSASVLMVRLPIFLFIFKEEGKGKVMEEGPYTFDQCATFIVGSMTTQNENGP